MTGKLPTSFLPQSSVQPSPRQNPRFVLQASHVGATQPTENNVMKMRFMILTNNDHTTISRKLKRKVKNCKCDGHIRALPPFGVPPSGGPGDLSWFAAQTWNSKRNASLNRGQCRDTSE